MNLNSYPPGAPLNSQSSDIPTEPVTLAGLIHIVKNRRERGERAVFTNGGFDLLHVGHIRSLQDARLRADYLIVGINDDASVARAKGPDRPIYPALERAEMLLALEAVDYVIVFSDDTVDPILEAVRPEIYAKGTDYTPETIPETPTVRAYGGEIAIVGDPKNHSTRSTLAKIQTRG